MLFLIRFELGFLDQIMLSKMGLAIFHILHDAFKIPDDVF